MFYKLDYSHTHIVTQPPSTNKTACLSKYVTDSLNKFVSNCVSKKSSHSFNKSSTHISHSPNDPFKQPLSQSCICFSIVTDTTASPSSRYCTVTVSSTDSSSHSRNDTFYIKTKISAYYKSKNTGTECTTVIPDHTSQCVAMILLLVQLLRLSEHRFVLYMQVFP